jgi:hypothetical protein
MDDKEQKALAAAAPELLAALKCAEELFSAYCSDYLSIAWLDTTTALLRRLEASKIQPTERAKPGTGYVHRCPHGHPDSAELHPCPFQQEIHENNANWCRCCPVCVENCTDEI